MRSTFKLLYFVKRNAVKKNGNAPNLVQGASIYLYI